MAKNIKVKYIYFLLPLTYVFVCVFVSINYILTKNIRSAIQTIFIGVASSVVYFLILPLIISSIGFQDMFNGNLFFICFYVFSTIMGIFFIKQQEKYLRTI